jgi:hypothetical protein
MKGQGWQFQNLAEEGDGFRCLATASVGLRWGQGGGNFPDWMRSGETRFGHFSIILVYRLAPSQVLLNLNGSC